MKGPLCIDITGVVGPARNTEGTLGCFLGLKHSEAEGNRPATFRQETGKE